MAIGLITSTAIVSIVMATSPAATSATATAIASTSLSPATIAANATAIANATGNRGKCDGNRGSSYVDRDSHTGSDSFASGSIGDSSHVDGNGNRFDCIDGSGNRLGIDRFGRVDSSGNRLGSNRFGRVDGSGNRLGSDRFGRVDGSGNYLGSDRFSRVVDSSGNGFDTVDGDGNHLGSINGNCDGSNGIETVDCSALSLSGFSTPTRGSASNGDLLYHGSARKIRSPTLLGEDGNLLAGSFVLSLETMEALM